MKRLIVVIVCTSVILSSCFLYFFRDDSLGGWEIVGDQYFPEEDLEGLDLVRHPEDGLLLVLRFYEGSSANCVIRVYQYTSSGWTVYTDDFYPDMTGGEVRAGILEDGSLCVVPLWMPPMVLVWNGNSWDHIEDSGFENLWIENAYFSDAGELFLMLENPDDEYSGLIYSYSGETWEILGTAGEFPRCLTPRMCLDPEGNPVFYFAGEDSETGTVSFEVLRWTGTAWEALADLPEDITTPSFSKHSIIASDTALYCLVVNTEGDNSLYRVLEYTGTEWMYLPDQPVTEADSGGWDFIIGNNEYPLLAMEDEGAFIEITVCSYNGTSWDTVGIDGFTFGDAADTAVMTIGTDGYLYLAYRAVGHDNVAAVMRYPLNP